MDPDEALKQLRHLVQTYRDGDMADPLAHHEEMVETFEGLDEWLSWDGGEIDDIRDLVEGEVVELDWVGTLNGQEVPIKVRLSEVNPLDDQEED